LQVDCPSAPLPEQPAAAAAAAVAAALTNGRGLPGGRGGGVSLYPLAQSGHDVLADAAQVHKQWLCCRHEAYRRVHCLMLQQLLLSQISFKGTLLLVYINAAYSCSSTRISRQLVMT
jgi:hypothetical protein